MKAVQAAKVSAKVLWGYKLRTGLSCLAVGTGVAAFVAMVGVGASARQDVLLKIDAYGGDVLAIRPLRLQPVGRRSLGGANFSSLTAEDVRFLRSRIQDVRAVSGFLQRDVSVSRASKHIRVLLVAVEPAYFSIRRITAAKGRVFSEAEARGRLRVAVLGHTIAAECFGSESPIGQTVRINTVLFTVVGEAAAKGADPTGDDQDRVVYVPLTAARGRLLTTSRLDGIWVQIVGELGNQQPRKGIEAALRQRRRATAGNTDGFVIQEQVDAIRSKSEATQIFTTLLGGIAVVCLLVGVGGILTVMMVSIGERAVEIGLRRALGARRHDIRVQFLLEGALLAGVGALLGAIVGLGGSLLVSRLAGWPSALPWAAAALVSAGAVALGILCGVYPAERLALIEPATVLRSRNSLRS